MLNYVTVTSFANRTQAEVAKGLLLINGINSVITSDDAGRMYPVPFMNKVGVELKVEEKDLAKAKKVLKISDKSDT